MRSKFILKNKIISEQPMFVSITTVVCILLFMTLTLEQILQNNVYNFSAKFIYVSQVQGVSPSVIICALDNGQIAQINVTNAQTLQPSSQLQLHSTTILNPIMVKKKINQTTATTDFLISNNTNFQHLRFKLGVFFSNKVISIDSQILQMEFGVNQFLLSFQNNYIILLKNNFIFQKRLFSNPITKIKYNPFNNSFLVANNIGELSYYNHVIPSESLLLAYWNFQEFNLNKSYDVTGNNKTAVFLPGASISPKQTQRGKQGLFQISMPNIQITNFSNPQTSFSISLWFLKFSFTSNTTKTRLISKDRDQGGFWISLSEVLTGDIMFGVRAFPNASFNFLVTNGNAFRINQVNHLVAIFDYQNAKTQIYLNQTLIKQITFSKSFASIDTGPATIGTQNMTNWGMNYGGFDGTIDEIMFFNKSLNASQINQLHTNKLKTIFKADSQITSINLPSVLNSTNYQNIDIGTSSGSIYQLVYNSSTFQMDTISINNNITSSVQQFVNQIQTSPNMSIFASDSGQIFQVQKFVNEIKYYDSKSITNSGNSIFIVQGQNSTIFTIELGTSSMSVWSLNYNLICDQSCQTCSIYKNQTACSTCSYELSLMNSSDSTSCIQKCGKQYNKINGVCILRQSILSTSSTIMSSIMSMPSARVAAKFMYPLFVFLQDIWFYKYHNKNFSVFIQNVFQETQKINQAIVIPDFVSLDAIDNQVNITSFISTQSYKQRVRIQYKYVQIFNPGFMFNCLSTIIWETFKSMLGVIAFYISAKLLVYLFDKHGKLRIVIDFLLNKGTLATFIVSLIETNLISLTFYSFLQLQQCYYLNSNEKLNIIVCVICLFSMLFYSIAFYFILLEYSTKSVGQSILNYTQWSSSSFFQAFYIYTVKNFVNASIHVLLFDYYLEQNILLAFVNFFQLIIVLYFRNCFTFQLSFIFLASYYLVFFIFDILLILQHLEIQWVIANQNDYYCEIILILLLCGSTILLLFVELIGPIYKWVKQRFSQNKVQDQPKIKINQIKQHSNQNPNSFSTNTKQGQSVQLQQKKSKPLNNQINFRRRNGFTNQLKNIKQYSNNSNQNQYDQFQNVKKAFTMNKKQIQQNYYQQQQKNKSKQKTKKTLLNSANINQANIQKIKKVMEQEQNQKKYCQQRIKQIYQKYWLKKQPIQKQSKTKRQKQKLSFFPMKKTNKIKSNYDQKMYNIQKGSMNVKYL